jgi:hypothetical protein
MPINKPQPHLKLVKVVPGPYLDFDLREILTDEDECAQYREQDKNIDHTHAYRFYNYISGELATVLHVNEHHSLPLHPALSACAHYGSNNCANHPAFRDMRHERSRALGWHSYKEGDKSDINSLLAGMKLTYNDGGEGYKLRYKIRCPEPILRQMGKVVTVLSIPMSTAVQRFIMDGLRKQPGVQAEYKEIMDAQVTELYVKIARQAQHVRNALNALGVPK